MAIVPAQNMPTADHPVRPMANPVLPDVKIMGSISHFDRDQSHHGTLLLLQKWFCLCNTVLHLEDKPPVVQLKPAVCVCVVF